MINKTLKFFLFFLFFPLLIFAGNNFPAFPMAFWGSATIDDQPLPEGTTIQAYCSTDLIGEVEMIEDGVYGYNDATKIRLLVSFCDGDILFKYFPSRESEPRTGDTKIKYTNGFEKEKTIQKDLNFTTEPAPTPPSSGGVGGGRDRDVPDGETEDESEETPEGEVLGEMDVRDYKEQEDVKEKELKDLKSDKSRLNRMRELVDSLLQVVEEENKKEHEETLLIIIERLEEIEEKVEQEIEETEERLEEIRRKVDLFEQKERLEEMEKMINTLFQSIEDDESKEEARKALEAMIGSIQNLKDRINNKLIE